MLNEAYFAADSTLEAHEDVESSLRWIAYFRTNEHQLIDLPWDAGVTLSTEERSALLPSIQDFQLGESSEGVNPKRLAEEYARRSGDVHYPEAMRIFLGEEHRHARLLGRYLDLAGAPRLEYSWDDAIFRRLRRLIGMEFMLMTLLMAETIAKVYYRALYHASACKLLRRICAQILRDEKPHVEFHVERLAIMRRGANALVFARRCGSSSHDVRGDVPCGVDSAQADAAARRVSLSGVLGLSVERVRDVLMNDLRRSCGIRGRRVAFRSAKVHNALSRGDRRLRAFLRIDS